MAMAVGCVERGNGRVVVVNGPSGSRFRNGLPISFKDMVTSSFWICRMLGRTGTVLVLMVETPWSALSRHEDEVAISGIWTLMVAPRMSSTSAGVPSMAIKQMGPGRRRNFRTTTIVAHTTVASQASD